LRTVGRHEIEFGHEFTYTAGGGNRRSRLFFITVWGIEMYDKDNWKQELRERLEEIAKRKEREKKGEKDGKRN